MSFTIQHPTSGLSWSTDADGKIILSSSGASVYTVDDVGHILNTNMDVRVRNLGADFFETGLWGAMPEFEWTIGGDGAISNGFYGQKWIGEDLTVSDAPFLWKKVAPTRSASLKATAAAPPPPPAPVVDPSEFSSGV